MITAALQPTALTIRHSRFATLTLAKLVASLALHPPVSATEADYAPHQSAHADSFSSRRSLLAAALMEQCGLAASWSCCLLKARLWKPSPGREKVSSDSETDEGEGGILLMLEDAVTKSLLLEEKVLNAVKRMRCSRRSGVILYSYDNGHFMAYTSSVSSR